MPHGQEMRFTADLNGMEWSVVQLFRILQRQGQICAAMVESIRPMRLFVNNLPNNINNEALAVEFLKYDIVILSGSIQPAWNKDYCWADLAVAETDYNRAFEMGNRLFGGRSIPVKPFIPKGKVPQSICPGQGMRFTMGRPRCRKRSKTYTADAAGNVTMRPAFKEGELSMRKGTHFSDRIYICSGGGSRYDGTIVG
ncbi:hypothetical protein B0H14DRAFT_2575528 [Mycena olivaceomarginata]|nr:hypothetical protein B0H14DRAFT_2575528 [Mycena olivaceomarginata]